METLRQFATRVEVRTGRPLAGIPIVGEQEPVRHILCRWTSATGITVVVVGMDDQPQEDEDGGLVFTQFGKVILK